MSLANCLHMHFPWKNTNAVALLKKLEPILWDEVGLFPYWNFQSYPPYHYITYTLSQP